MMFTMNPLRWASSVMRLHPAAAYPIQNDTQVVPYDVGCICYVIS